MKGLVITLSLVIIGLVAYLIFFLPKPVDGFSKEKDQIDSLTTEIAKLQFKHIKLDSTIMRYKDSLSIKDHEIDSTNRKLKEERKYYGNKMKDINKYTPTELDSFFSDRYNK